MMRRATLTGISVAVLIVATSAAWVAGGGTGDNAGPDRPGVRLASILWPEPIPVAEFELRDQYGRPFDRGALAGRWNLVFFGYLDCPDICPMSLSAMQRMRALLEQRGAADDVQFVFVSVDGARDDAERMRAYLAAFDESFVGLTGEPAMIERLAGSMAVHYTPAAGDGTIRHTSSLMIVGPRARTVGAFQPPLVPERMAAGFGALRRQSGRY
ncbi:MAG: SCO family protein [Wenzhouxiangellaceae bacterium]|nr:SCO family protein [Wenzhouxiangellaceae bacterium]